MGWQAGDTLGIFLGFTANIIASSASRSDSWRWQTASISVPAFVLMVLLWAIPDSPRLYLKKGEYSKAFDAMCQLRETPLQAARDLFYANAQLQVEAEELLENIQFSENDLRKMLEDLKMAEDAELDRPGRDFIPSLMTYQAKVRKLRWWNRIWALVTNDRTRRALFAALIVMISQQLCGL